jgi:large repetitive protein
LRIVSVGSATQGQVVLNTDGTITYTPEANLNENNSALVQFQYTVSDGVGGLTTGVASIRLAAVNDAPVVGADSAFALEDAVVNLTSSSLLANDLDVDNAHGQLSISSVSNSQGGTAVMQQDGSITFTPQLNFNGVASFTYTVSDSSGGLASNTVTLNYQAVNDAPDLLSETLQSTEDATVFISAATLLANDSDVDNSSADLRITAVSNPSVGSVELVSSGAGRNDVRFMPPANFYGTASFTYTVSDGVGGSSSVTALVQIASVNDAPIATDDSLPASNEDTNLVITARTVLGNDTAVQDKRMGKSA